MKLMQIIHEELVKELLTSGCDRGDMLQIQKKSARREEAENLGIKGLLPFIRLMMDGETRDNDIKWSMGSYGISIEPMWRAKIGFCKGSVRQRAHILAGGIEHRIGKINEKAVGRRRNVEEKAAENAVTTSEVKDAGRSGAPELSDLANDLQLQICARYRSSDTLKKGCCQLLRLPFAFQCVHLTP